MVLRELCDLIAWSPERQGFDTARLPPEAHPALLAFYTGHVYAPPPEAAQEWFNVARCPTTLCTAGMWAHVCHAGSNLEGVPYRNGRPGAPPWFAPGFPGFAPGFAPVFFIPPTPGLFGGLAVWRVACYVWHPCTCTDGQVVPSFLFFFRSNSHHCSLWPERICALLLAASACSDRRLLFRKGED